MTVTTLNDIIEPQQFTQYIVDTSATKTRFSESGILIANDLINQYLKSGSTTFNVPYWRDIKNGAEADIISDDPAEFSVPKKFTAYKQTVRKSFLHNSWSTMGLAAEVAGSNPLDAVQDRVVDYWSMQLQKRLIATTNGIKAANVADNAADMVVDISAGAGAAAKFSAGAVIDTAATLGDAFGDVVGIAMHSTIYFQALKNDLLVSEIDSNGKPFQTFRGLMVIVDDGLVPDASGNYTTVLFGRGAFGYGMAKPVHSEGTAIEVIESAGNGGGQQILHSRINMAIHPLGFSWTDGVAGLDGDSPTIAELADPLHWTRMTERKNVPLAFLVTK